MHLLEWMNFQNIHVEVQFLCSSCIWNFWFPGSIFIWKLSLPSYLFCGFLYLPPKSHCPSQVSCWKLRKPIPTQQRQAGCLGKQPASHRVTNSAGLFPWLNALLSQSWILKCLWTCALSLTSEGAMKPACEQGSQMQWAPPCSSLPHSHIRFVVLHQHTISMSPQGPGVPENPKSVPGKRVMCKQTCWQLWLATHFVPTRTSFKCRRRVLRNVNNQGTHHILCHADATSLY